MKFYDGNKEVEEMQLFKVSEDYQEIENLVLKGRALVEKLENQLDHYMEQLEGGGS